MSEDFGPTFLTVTDEEGKELVLEFMDALEYNGQLYQAFFPAETEGEEEDPDAGYDLPEGRTGQDIVLDRVSFGYVPQQPVLHDLSLTIPAGKTTAIIGNNGSGKSTLTHAKHNGKYDAFGGIKVLHDDAFIINTDTCASVALEPTYFDKTADYPTGCPDNTFLLTAQNCSATLDEEGHIQLVTEDIRNGNGRAIKSKLWSPNRVDKIDAPVNAIFWIMKDPTIPPVVKLKGSALASVMGATLATKTSTAERVAAGTDLNALRIVPYANPFRTYPLVNDYEKFKKLVEEKNVDCYIVNTGDFMGTKCKPADTLGILETIVEGKAKFEQWGPFEDIEIMYDWSGKTSEAFKPDLTDKAYTEALKNAMQNRVDAVEGFATKKEGYDKLPDEALAALKKIVDEAASL